MSGFREATTAVHAVAGKGAGTDGWYSLAAEEVSARLGVDPAVGLSRLQAAELLDRDGPNALPAEEAVAGWRRFVDQYRPTCN